jgi:predicted nucleic acid binding AN1-type Zn finger protein
MEERIEPFYPENQIPEKKEDEDKIRHWLRKDKEKDRIMRLSGTCDFCKKKIGGPKEDKWGHWETADLPFECNYCNKIFCQDHRLPEQHNCDGLSKDKKGELNKY